jgi:hypothetical protein
MMPGIYGTYISLARGESLQMSVTVLDEDGAPDTDITAAIFAYRPLGGTTVSASCTVVDNVVSYTIPSATTLLFTVGQYEYEFRIASSLSQVDSLVVGTISVLDTPITEDILPS